MGCDIQFAKEGGADLSGFLPEKEFYAMDYPKWKGEGFFEFFDEETCWIWDKDAGFPKGFRDILLRTFRNRVIIPSEIHGSSTSFKIPQFNIVGPNEIQKLLSNQAHNVKSKSKSNRNFSNN